MTYKKINIFFILIFIVTYIISLLFIPSDLHLLKVNQVQGSFIDIFINNFKACNITILVSIFTFGLKSLSYIILNAYNLETICELITIDIKYSLLIIPHAIFEVPTMILTASLPLKILRDLFYGSKKDHIISLKIFLTIQFLILLAALIEGFFTPWIGNKILFN